MLKLSARVIRMIVSGLILTAPVAIAQTSPIPDSVARGLANSSESYTYRVDNAKVWLQAALSAMGGEVSLQAIKTLKFKGNGHTYLLEQSERPDGPWIVNYEEIAELHDLEKRILRQTVSTRGPAAGPEITSITTEGMTYSFAAGAQPRPFRSMPGDDEWLALSPVRVLLTALAAPDLHSESDALLQLLYQHSVKPEYTVRHHWKTGDVAFWDNRATQHAVVGDFAGQHRVIQRVTRRGDEPR